MSALPALPPSWGVPHPSMVRPGETPPGWDPNVFRNGLGALGGTQYDAAHITDAAHEARERLLTWAPQTVKEHRNKHDALALSLTTNQLAFFKHKGEPRAIARVGFMQMDKLVPGLGLGALGGFLAESSSWRDRKAFNKLHKHYVEKVIPEMDDSTFYWFRGEHPAADGFGAAKLPAGWHRQPGSRYVRNTRSGQVVVKKVDASQKWGEPAGWQVSFDETDGGGIDFMDRHKTASGAMREAEAWWRTGAGFGAAGRPDLREKWAKSHAAKNNVLFRAKRVLSGDVTDTKSLEKATKAFQATYLDYIRAGGGLRLSTGSVIAVVKRAIATAKAAQSGDMAALGAFAGKDADAFARQGERAYLNSRTRGSNPFAWGSWQGQAWDDGWYAASRAWTDEALYRAGLNGASFGARRR